MKNQLIKNIILIVTVKIFSLAKSAFTYFQLVILKFTFTNYAYLQFIIKSLNRIWQLGRIWRQTNGNVFSPTFHGLTGVYYCMGTWVGGFIYLNNKTSPWLSALVISNHSCHYEHAKGIVWPILIGMTAPLCSSFLIFNSLMYCHWEGYNISNTYW